MVINIYLGTKGWKWTGDEYKPRNFMLEPWLSIIFLVTWKIFFKFFKYIIITIQAEH